MKFTIHVSCDPLALGSALKQEMLKVDPYNFDSMAKGAQTMTGSETWLV